MSIAAYLLMSVTAAPATAIGPEPAANSPATHAPAVPVSAGTAPAIPAPAATAAAVPIPATTAPIPAISVPAIAAAPAATRGVSQTQAPFGFLTAGELAERCRDASPFSVSYCYAYLAGIHDSMRAYEVWLGQREFCPPARVTQRALRDAFVTFIAANPGFAKAQSASASVVALKEAYPCPSAKP